MATTREGPSIDWSKAGSDVWSLMLDTARSKLVDVEQVGDERNVPDMTDLRTGNYPRQTITGTAGPQVQGGMGGGMSTQNMVMIGGLILGVAGLVYVMAD